MSLELVVRDHGGSTKFPEVTAYLAYALPGGGRMTLLSNVGCSQRPNVVEEHVVGPLAKLGIPVVRMSEPPLPADDHPKLFSNYDDLYLQVESLRALVLSLSERCQKQSDLLSRKAETPPTVHDEPTLAESLVADFGTT